VNTETSSSPIPDSAARYRIGDHLYDLSRRALVMGIVNITPDSFSDGGEWLRPEDAVAHALRLEAEGADLLDLGAESTRPGAARVKAEEEIARLAPVLEQLAGAVRVPISVDTSKPEVARAALETGAAVVNDVTGLRLRDASGRPAMARLAAERNASLVVMHMLGEPATMQQDPRYQDVVREVGDYLEEAAGAAAGCGVSSDRIALDPGIGFGKTLEHNLELLRHLDRLAERGYPVLVGVSRKSLFGKLLDLAVDERLEASLAAAVAAFLRGARILRVHDVEATVRSLRVAESLL
jgi:dihydropteroate synthase